MKIHIKLHLKRPKKSNLFYSISTITIWNVININICDTRLAFFAFERIQMINNATTSNENDLCSQIIIINSIWRNYLYIFPWCVRRMHKESKMSLQFILIWFTSSRTDTYIHTLISLQNMKYDEKLIAGMDGSKRNPKSHYMRNEIPKYIYVKWP